MVENDTIKILNELENNNKSQNKSENIEDMLIPLETQA